PAPPLIPLPPAAAPALPGPDGLRDRRRAAAERAEAAGLPSPGEEVWRYSRGGPPAHPRFTPGPTGPTPPTAPTGVEIGPLADAKAGDEVLGAVLGEAPDAFAELNTAFAPDPLLVRVAPGTVVEKPLVLAVHAEGDARATFPRLLVEVGAGAAVALAT